MKRKIIICRFLAIAFAFVLITSCENFSKTKLEQVNIDTNYDSSNVSNDQLPVLKLERKFGECLGLCPVYNISIFDDGRVLYEGIKNVKSLGHHESVISKSELKKTIDKFNNLKFLEFADNYIRGKNCSEVVLSDGAFAKIYFRNGPSSKTVLHYDGCHVMHPVNQAARLRVAC